MYREMNQKGVAWQRFFVISKYEQKEEEKIGIIVIAKASKILYSYDKCYKKEKKKCQKLTNNHTKCHKIKKR